MCEPYEFKPDGNDLRKVFYYYGLDLDEKLVCPFHDDNRPSFHTNFDEGVFHCFACQVSGDALQFVKLANQKISELNQLILYHAILNSKKVKGLQIKELRSSKSRKQQLDDSKLHTEIAYDYYHGLKSINWLKENDQNKDYMINRGFNSKALNLCKAKLTYTDINYPLIFPVYDMDEFRGFVCRTTIKRVEEKRKYLYNKGFSRRNTLCGQYNNEVVVLVEGYMDRLKFMQFGLKYVTAIFGWKITSEQVAKLKVKGVKTIISALDMDGPGIKGTDYLANFFNVVKFQFPEGVKDPGDLDLEQFKIAYKKTKTIYRRKKHVNFK